MRKQFLPLMVALTMALVFHACSQFNDMEEIDEVAWTGDVALPLLNSSISIQEILDEVDEEDIDFLSIDDNTGRINLYYEDEPTSQNMATLLDEMSSFPLALIDTSMEIPVDLFDEVEVRTVQLKSGTLTFNLDSPFEEDLNLTISIPQLTKNGQIFQVQRYIDYQGSIPVSVQIDPVSIEGYALDMPEGTVNVHYSATRTASGEAVKFDYIGGEADNWAFSDMIGYWTTERYEIKKDSIELEIYDEWVEVDLRFEDPRLAITVDNSFGFATEIRVKTLSVRTASGEEIAFKSDVVDNAFQVAYPSLNEMGTYKQTIFSFTKENSNIVDIVNAKPTAIIYELEALVNPDDAMTEMGFLTAESEIVSTVSVDLPLVISATNFSIEETVEFDLNDIEDIRNAEFKLLTTNSIPAEFGVQFYFVDDQNAVVDSLFDQELALIAAAAVNAQGDVSQATENSLLIPIPDDRMEQIRQAGKLQLEASMSTTNDGAVPVRILSTQELDVKLGVKFGLE
ncbi:MAG: hypothetical protein AAFP19_21435 [Bacteroidota bacterium]